MSNQANARKYSQTVRANPRQDPNQPGLLTKLFGQDKITGGPDAATGNYAPYAGSSGLFGGKSRRDADALNRILQTIKYQQQLGQQDAKFATDEDVRGTKAKESIKTSEESKRLSDSLVKELGLPPEMRNRIQDYFDAHANILNSTSKKQSAVTASPEGQDMIGKSTIGSLAGPALAAQKASEIRVGPQEAVGYRPNGNINANMEVARGLDKNQTIEETGGITIKDPNSPMFGQTIGGKPMVRTTTSPARFSQAPVGKGPTDMSQLDTSALGGSSFAPRIMSAPDANAALQANNGTAAPSIKAAPPNTGLLPSMWEDFKTEPYNPVNINRNITDNITLPLYEMLKKFLWTGQQAPQQ